MDDDEWRQRYRADLSWADRVFWYPMFDAVEESKQRLAVALAYRRWEHLVKHYNPAPYELRSIKPVTLWEELSGGLSLRHHKVLESHTIPLASEVVGVTFTGFALYPVDFSEAERRLWMETLEGHRMMPQDAERMIRHTR